VSRRAPGSPTALLVRQARSGALITALSLAALVRVGVAAFEASGAAQILKSAGPIVNSPAIRALQGYAYGVGTAGGFTVWKEGAYIAAAAAAWLALTATRLTRAAEDDGSWDLLVLGSRDRRAVLFDVVRVLVGAATLVAAGVFVGFASRGWSPAAAGLFAVGVALVALTYASVALVAAQLYAPRRLASTAAVAVLVVGFVTRMMADGTSGLRWLDWLTPFGWLESLRSYGVRDPAMLAPLIIAPAVLVAVAGALATRRDVGAGRLSGDDTARAHPRLLGSTLGFAWRERLTVTSAWALASVVFAALLGSLSHAIDTFVGQDAAYQRLLARWGFTLLFSTRSYVAEIELFWSLALGLLVINSLHAQWADEVAGRLDLPLATGPSRGRWAVASLGAAVAAVVVVAGATALGLWVGATASGGSLPLGSALAGALNGALAVAPVAGVMVLLQGVAPRVALPVVSVALVGAFVLDVFGPTLHWPARVIGLSPFHHVAAVPAVGMDWPAALALAGFGLLAAALGVGAFARRDLAVG
jgi:ABC-2 type transport system permease protein